jgi:hypothetical protein
VHHTYPLCWDPKPRTRRHLHLRGHCSGAGNVVAGTGAGQHGAWTWHQPRADTFPQRTLQRAPAGRHGPSCCSSSLRTCPSRWPLVPANTTAASRPQVLPIHVSSCSPRRASALGYAGTQRRCPCATLAAGRFCPSPARAATTIHRPAHSRPRHGAGETTASARVPTAARAAAYQQRYAAALYARQRTPRSGPGCSDQQPL